MKNTLTAFSILVLSSTASWALPATYSAGPTWATVVDAETKEPIGGVLILALWDLEGGMETSRMATFKFAEATTDKNGEFRISGWGPAPRPPKGFLDTYDPQLLVFKTGYVPERLLNSKMMALGKRVNLEVHDSTWNGKTIILKKYDGPLRQYSQRVAFIVDSLRYVLNGTDCGWKQIPKTVRALEDEGKREAAAGIDPSFTASAELLMSRKACAPVDEFGKAYREAYQK